MAVMMTWLAPAVVAIGAILQPMVAVVIAAVPVAVAAGTGAALACNGLAADEKKRWNNQYVFHAYET